MPGKGDGRLNQTASALNPAPALSPAPALVRLKGVGVTLGGRQVLSGLDMEVHKGEIVTLVGPNGAGKSTLAKLVLGLIEPSEGTVEKARGLCVGYLPQRFTVDPVLPLSVKRFLCLPRPAPRERMEEALAEVGAGGLLERAVQTLSGGELQRVLLARAILREPDLLVLDEPTQQVDLGGQVELFERIAKLRDHLGCGILLISHDLHVVMAATDRVICLNHHICCSGEPEAVSRHPEYLHLFGDRAARTMAVYSHEHDHHHDLSGGVVGEEEEHHHHHHGHHHGQGHHAPSDADASSDHKDRG